MRAVAVVVALFVMAAIVSLTAVFTYREAMPRNSFQPIPAVSGEPASGVSYLRRQRRRAC